MKYRKIENDVLPMNERQLKKRIQHLQGEVHALKVRMGYQSRSAQKMTKSKIAQMEATIAHFERKLKEGKYIGGAAERRQVIEQREESNR